MYVSEASLKLFSRTVKFKGYLRETKHAGFRITFAFPADVSIMGAR